MAYALGSRSTGSTSAPLTRVRRHGPGRHAGLAGKGRGPGELAPAATPGPMPVLQTKLEVGAPDDRFEREAERVADQVMRMPASATVAASAPAGGAQRSVQRVCDECAEEESARLQRMPLPAAPAAARISALRAPLVARPTFSDQAAVLQRQDLEEDEVLQARTAAGAPPDVLRGVEAGVHAPQGGGQPLSATERAFFEPRFGHDFGQVRIHADTRAADSARALNARAYTLGTHIVFGSGQFAVGTIAGRRLLAHELTHVVQQREGGPAVQRKIKFTDPTPTRENPIKRVLSEPTLGYTLPTVNGKALPDLKTARSLLFDALQPKESSYDASAKECRFDEFDVDVSANVTVITQPTNNRWTMSLPGAAVKGIAACHSQASVPVTMTGKPDGPTIVNLVDQFEQEHVDDLKQLYAKHLEAHFTWLIGLREQGDDAGKCQEKLMATLGNKDAVAVQTFATEWLAAVAARDDKGGHTFKNAVRATAKCASITIEASK